MLSIKDVKSNNFAYFDTLANGQVPSSVKSAFKYIVSLSNLSGTYIDDWDIQAVFMSDGRWLTDKGDINKAFFTRKEAVAANLPGVPEHLVSKLEIPLKRMTEGPIRTVKQNIENLRRDINNHYSSIDRRVRELKTNNEKLYLHEIASKTKALSLVETVNRILRELPLDLWNVSDDRITFICKTDTLVPNRDKLNEIDRVYNLGRLIIEVDSFEMKIRLRRLDYINRWVDQNKSHFHYGSYLCTGGFSQDFADAQTSVDIFKLLNAFIRWKDTYDAASTLTSVLHFNHHPAFTTYNEDDFMFPMSEIQRIKQCDDAGLYYCDPMVPFNTYANRIEADHGYLVRSRIESYAFAVNGGPKPGGKYEEPCPLESSLNRENDRYSMGKPELTYAEHREWLALQYDSLWRWSNFTTGEEAPTPDCGVYDPLYADTGACEWLSESGFESRHDCHPDDYVDEELEEDNE